MNIVPCMQDAHSRLQHEHGSQQAELDRCRAELAGAQRAQQEASAAAGAVAAEAKELQDALQASQVALLHADRRHEQVRGRLVCYLLQCMPRQHALLDAAASEAVGGLCSVCQH